MKIALSWVDTGEASTGMAVYAREMYRALGRVAAGERFLVCGSFWRDFRRRARQTRDLLPEGFDSAFCRRPRNLEQWLAWHRLCPGPERTLRARGVALFHGIDQTAPPLARVPGVLTVHDIGFLTHPEWFASAQAPLAWHRFLARTLAQSRVICAISDYTRRELLARFRLPPARVRVVYNGGAAAFYRPLAPADVPADFRDRHRLPGRFVLAVAPSTPHKNLPVLLEAFSGLAGKHRDLQLVFVGAPGADHPRLVSRAAAAGLADRVRFVPPVSGGELLCFYNLASVFVFPSLYEGFGLPVLEAMACGCPTLVARSACLPEIAGGAALDAAPERPDDFAGALEKIISSRALAEELRGRGLARAACFSWEKTARETLGIYHEVANQTR